MDFSEFINKSFDIKFALSALYLWLLFGYLSTMVACDLQKWMANSMLFRHFIGLSSFLLLFTVFDSTNQVPIQVLITKSIIVYIAFIFMIKSKWYFALPVLVILIIDQLIKAQVIYLNKDEKNNQNTINRLNKIRYILGAILGILIITGFILYVIRQKIEFGDKFNVSTLLFSSKCNL